MNHRRTDALTFARLQERLEHRGPIWKYSVLEWNTLPKVKEQIRLLFAQAEYPLPGKLDLFSTSAKTAKSLGFGYRTAVVYLHPHTSSGLQDVNLCKFSVKECRAACLVESGRMRMKASQGGRDWKTRLYVWAPNLYRLMAVYEAHRLKVRADAEGLKFGVRMDGTSDTGELVMLYQIFRDLGIHAWDYTKDFQRAWEWRQEGLFTYSYSGTQASFDRALELLDYGANVSVVFRTGRNEPLPMKWEGYRVIDGDEHDLRFLDGPRTVVGLRLKGTNNSKAQAGRFAVKV